MRKGFSLLELVITIIITGLLVGIMAMFLGSSFTIFRSTNVNTRSYDYLQLLSEFVTSQTKSAEELEIFDSIDDMLPLEDGYRYIYLDTDKDDRKKVFFSDGENYTNTIPTISTDGVGDYTIIFSTEDDSILDVQTELETYNSKKNRDYSISLESLLNRSSAILHSKATDKSGTAIRYKSDLPIPTPPILYSVTVPKYNSITEPDENNNVNIVLKSNNFIDLENLIATYQYSADSIKVFGSGDTHPDDIRDYSKEVVVILESAGFLPVYYFINVDIDGDAELFTFDLFKKDNPSLKSSRKDKIGDFFYSYVSLYFFNDEIQIMDSLIPTLTFEADKLTVNGNEIDTNIFTPLSSKVDGVILPTSLNFNYPISVTVEKGPYVKTYIINSFVEPILTELEYSYNGLTRFAKINQSTSTVSIYANPTDIIPVKVNYIGNSVVVSDRNTLDNSKIISNSRNNNDKLKPDVPSPVALNNDKRIIVYGNEGSFKTYMIVFEDSALLTELEYNESTSNNQILLNEHVFRKKVAGLISYNDINSTKGDITVLFPQNEFLYRRLASFETSNILDVTTISNKLQQSEIKEIKDLTKDFTYVVESPISKIKTNYFLNVLFSDKPTVEILNDNQLVETFNDNSLALTGNYNYSQGFNRTIKKYKYVYEMSNTIDFTTKETLVTYSSDLLNSNPLNIEVIPLNLGAIHENKYIRLGISVISDTYEMDNSTYGGVESDMVYTDPYFYEQSACPISPFASNMYNNRFLSPNVMYLYYPLDNMPMDSDFDVQDVVIDASKIIIPKYPSTSLSTDLLIMINNNDFKNLDSVISKIGGDTVSPSQVINMGLRKGSKNLELLLLFNDSNILPDDGGFKSGFPIVKSGGFTYPSGNTEISKAFSLENVFENNKNKFALVDYAKNINGHNPINTSFKTNSGIGVWNDSYIDLQRDMDGDEDYFFFISTEIDTLTQTNGFRGMLSDDTVLPWSGTSKKGSNIQFVPFPPQAGSEDSLIHIFSWHGFAEQTHYGSVNKGTTDEVSNGTIMGTIQATGLYEGLHDYSPDNPITILAMKKRDKLVFQAFHGENFTPVLVSHHMQSPFLPSFPTCGIHSHEENIPYAYIYFGDSDYHNFEGLTFNKFTLLPIQSSYNINFDKIRVFVTTFN